MTQNKAKAAESAHAASAAEHLELQSYLPYRLSLTAEYMSRYLAGVYGERFGLSQNEWRVMHILSEGPAQSTQDVIALTSLDRLRVSRAAIRLEDKGLIARAAHPADQRAHLLQLTAKGRRTYAEIVPFAHEFQKYLAETLTAAEWQTLDRSLDKLNAALIARIPAQPEE